MAAVGVLNRIDVMKFKLLKVVLLSAAARLSGRMPLAVSMAACVLYVASFWLQCNRLSASNIKIASSKRKCLCLKWHEAIINQIKAKYQSGVNKIIMEWLKFLRAASLMDGSMT